MSLFLKGETAGVVLAGGLSRRFGSSKALALLDGVPLVEVAARSLGSVVSHVVVSTNDPEPMAGLGLPTVPDRHPRRGPLGGIHAGLEWAIERGAYGICCLPCDTPLVPPQVLRLLIDSAEGFDAVFPRSNAPPGFEPLIAWWGSACMPIIEAYLDRGGGAVHDLVTMLPRSSLVAIDELVPANDLDRVFHNVNTRDDLERLTPGSDAPT